MKEISNIKVGRPHTTPSSPAHTPGVREGNEPGAFAKQADHLPDGRATAKRSTGINPELRNPIDPTSPNLPPA